ncbi:NADPH:quinone oxidoreductase family protein [Kyrpidia tusciae]|uniref:Quinone oxidoreductase, YhdH/YhfP family n=1 Tax=Kyrpidia tusciae (strain DSM 2912 / NBRC 15312 / T2) TaxID=562970 RepID=D5WWK0_KYRT2|nr:acryloyl-CoA reductase [Kyrpidia tusciae]ADG07765.1 quinone oxidoreductase, YhdH/YhfP family [Kyrpidia tusciae DSM 2912]
MAKRFRAWVADKQGESIALNLLERDWDDLPPGEVTVRVAYSSVNYKDGLAVIPTGRVARRYPLVPGIDLAGTVAASTDARFREGDEVIVTGYDLGVSHDGGLSEYARVPADWVVPLPAGLSLKEAMVLGTAGFTAGLSVHRLELYGLRPEKGPVLVTGATGGVGSVAVAILAKLGYTVAASTGKAEAQAYLRNIGAHEVLSRDEVSAESRKALEKERWAAAVDPVGGRTLAYLLRTMKYGGAVALSGLTGGSALETTVFPFILRGVSLLGIDSAYCPMEERRAVWERLAGPWKPAGLADIGQEIAMEDVPATLEAILKGKVKGRTVIRMG